MSKIIGEITVTIDGEEKTFKVRRPRHSQQARLMAMLRNAADGFDVVDGKVNMKNIDPEKFYAYQIELCAIRLSDDEGKPLFTADEVDELGENVPLICKALDEMIGPAKTSVEHAGN